MNQYQPAVVATSVHDGVTFVVGRDRVALQISRYLMLAGGPEHNRKAAGDALAGWDFLDHDRRSGQTVFGQSHRNVACQAGGVIRNRHFHPQRHPRGANAAGRAEFRDRQIHVRGIDTIDQLQLGAVLLQPRESRASGRRSVPLIRAKIGDHINNPLFGVRLLRQALDSLERLDRADGQLRGSPAPHDAPQLLPQRVGQRLLEQVGLRAALVPGAACENRSTVNICGLFAREACSAKRRTNCFARSKALESDERSDIE